MEIGGFLAPHFRHLVRQRTQGVAFLSMLMEHGFNGLDRSGGPHGLFFKRCYPQAVDKFTEALVFDPQLVHASYFRAASFMLLNKPAALLIHFFRSRTSAA